MAKVGYDTERLLLTALWRLPGRGPGGLGRSNAALKLSLLVLEASRVAIRPEETIR
jgi:hypothetical protein